MKIRWVLLVFELFLVISLCVVGGDEGSIEASGEEEEEEEEEEQQFYFYIVDPSSPIHEEEAPEDSEGEKPDFIYNPNAGHRLVEFYAHWCPHCQHFREHYIEFAYRLQVMAQLYGVEVSTNAVSCVPHRSVCQDVGVASYPRMFLYLDGSTDGIEVNIWELHPFQVLRKIPGVDLDMEAEEDMEASSPLHLPANNLRNKKQPAGAVATEADFWLPRTKHDIYNDAYLSFDFTMRNAIFMTPEPLTNRTADALEQFLILLECSLPPAFELHKMISEIMKNFETVVKSEQALMEVVDKYPPKTKTWSESCRRGDPYAGYTCGLWELFHIMSVGFVEYNSWNVGDDWSYYHTDDVGNALRNFIEHFFGCEVCRLNFLQSYEACDHDRCNRLIDKAGTEENWKEFPMWLFETHNSVNRRLLRERAERENRMTTHEEETAAQWPSRSACPACWHGDGRWDPDMIYYFLRLTYWPEDPISVQHRQLLLEATPDYGEEEEEDDDNERINLIAYLIIGAILVSIASLYRERRRVARTGRHKKVDG